MKTATLPRPDGRGWRRARPFVPRHLWVAASGWVSRIFTAGIQLVSVRLLLDSLGIEGYAVFALLTGLQGWYLLSDGGVGIGVQNLVSEARAKGRSTVSLLCAGRLIAIALLVLSVGVLWGIAPTIAPSLLHSFGFMSDGEKTRVFFTSGALCIGFGIGSLVYKVWYAQQRGYLSNIVPAVTAAIGLAGIAAVRHLDAPHRLEASLAAFLVPTALVPLATLAAQSFAARSEWTVRREDFRAILRRAVGFWTFAIVAALTLQIDYVVMSHFLRAEDITIYALSTRVYGLAFFVYNAVLMALWPVFAERVAMKRWDDVRRQLVRTLGSGIAFMVACSIAMVWLMPVAIGLLAPRHPVLVPTALVLALGLYQVVRVWSDTFSTLLQSTSWLAPFWILVPAQALLSVGLQWMLTPRYGLVGLVAGLTASFLLTVAWGLPLAARIRARRDTYA